MNRAASSGAVLVPLIEALLEVPCEVDSEDDFRFMDMLIRARAIPRQKGVFSPSMLGACLRQAYFTKKGEKKLAALSPQTNGYFIHGNFIHLKWQFVLWKLHEAKILTLWPMPAESPQLDFNGDGTRPAVEMRIVDGDWGGTIDALVVIDDILYIVDFKGINLIEFQRTVKKGAKPEYRRQIVGYAMIAAQKLGLEFGGCLLVSECKAGPLTGRGSPLALHETFVEIPDFTGEVNRRLRTLRWFDAREELPPIECHSTSLMGFQECAFNRHCHAEVKTVQREREARARKSQPDWKVARPER